MPQPENFRVFGEPIHILTSTASTNGALCTFTQTCPPGGGPPPHRHAHEDETFAVISGRFELLQDGVWAELQPGESRTVRRGMDHTFRNCGDTEGVIFCLCTPGRLDEYLEAISTVAMPQDAQKLYEISDEYGITFLPPLGRT